MIQKQKFPVIKKGEKDWKDFPKFYKKMFPLRER